MLKRGAVRGVELSVDEKAVIGENDERVIKGDAGNAESRLGALFSVGLDSDQFVAGDFAGIGNEDEEGVVGLKGNGGDVGLVDKSMAVKLDSRVGIWLSERLKGCAFG